MGISLPFTSVFRPSGEVDAAAVQANFEALALRAITTAASSPPPGSAGDATTTTKGIVKLAGDLTGTADSPQIATGAITNSDISALAAIAFGKLASPTAPFGFNGQRLTGLADPTAAQDAATKAYVDSRAVLLPFSLPGTLVTQTGTARMRFPNAASLLSVSATSGVAPTGSAVIVDVHKNGTTVFTTQANRPTIAASTNVSDTEIPDATSIAAGDYLTVDVDQVGAATPGEDLTVIVRYREV